jgi:hypothetical protein
MRIKIENAYSDGHESTSIEEVAEFVYDPHDPEYEDREDALRGYLRQFTGDGHGIGRPKLGSYHEIVILDADDPALLGRSFDWD